MNKKILELPERVGWRDHVIGAGIGGAYVAWLLATVRSLGFARDEGTYFRAAMSYARWYELFFTRTHDALQRSAIDGPWADNHEHPPLMKALFSFSWSLLHEKWHVFSDASTAFRFPGMLMMGVALWVTYLFGARAYSRRAGVMAAVLLGLMPGTFYHAHLACFDVPIMAMWTWCIYVYWRAMKEGGIPWALATGVVYGLTLATKHNAWILPAVVVPHAFFVQRRPLLRQLAAGRLLLPAPIVAMAVLGPLVFYALWPWMWNDTQARLEEYLDFHLNHVYYNMEFLHVNYFNAPSPRGYMPVMIAATVPTVTLLLVLVGLVARGEVLVRRLRAWVLGVLHKEHAAIAAPDRVETDLLFLLAFGAALGPWLLPKTPIFGGTKHWMTAYPFLCLFAGFAFDRIARAASAAFEALPRLASDPRAKMAAQAAVVLCVVAAPLAETAHAHPYGLSAYVPLVGGTAGGADLGLNRQFWGFTTESLAPYFEKNARPGSSVYFHDTTWDAWSRLIDEKRIRTDLRGAGAPSDADIAICHLERHMVEVDYNEQMVFGTATPDYVLTHDGVPIIDVYRRKR